MHLSCSNSCVRVLATLPISRAAPGFLGFSNSKFHLQLIWPMTTWDYVHFIPNAIVSTVTVWSKVYWHPENLFDLQPVWFVLHFENGTIFEGAFWKIFYLLKKVWRFYLHDLFSCISSVLILKFSFCLEKQKCSLMEK